MSAGDRQRQTAKPEAPRRRQNTIKTSLDLSEDLHRSLKQHAAARGETMIEVIERLIRKHLGMPVRRTLTPAQARNSASVFSNTSPR